MCVCVRNCGAGGCRYGLAAGSVTQCLGLSAFLSTVPPPHPRMHRLAFSVLRFHYGPRQLPYPSDQLLMVAVPTSYLRLHKTFILASMSQKVTCCAYSGHFLSEAHFFLREFEVLVVRSVVPVLNSRIITGQVSWKGLEAHARRNVESFSEAGTPCCSPVQRRNHLQVDGSGCTGKKDACFESDDIYLALAELDALSVAEFDENPPVQE
jgi:hypothetical protein